MLYYLIYELIKSLRTLRMLIIRQDMSTYKYTEQELRDELDIKSLRKLRSYITALGIELTDNTHSNCIDAIIENYRERGQIRDG